MLGIVAKYAGNGEFQFWNQQLKKYRNVLTKYIMNTWITSIHKKLSPIQEYQHLWKLDWWHQKIILSIWFMAEYKDNSCKNYKIEKT